MFTHLAKRIADRSMVLTLCAAALCSAACKKEPAKGQPATGSAAASTTGGAGNKIQWAYDTWALANAAGREIVKNGGDTWFFLTVDYAFGAALERDATKAIEASGGKVLGEIKHPIKTADFSSFLLQAQNSKAKV